MANATNATTEPRDAELAAFLAPFLRTEGPRYRSADWLLSDFDETVWKLKFDFEYEIDWRVEITGGGLLTSPQHAALWEVLRSWLIVQTHVDQTGGFQYAPKPKGLRIQRAFHCIDYILLNAQTLNIAKHGLGTLTNNDLRTMISSIGDSRSIIDTVYRWPDRLATYLRAQIADLSPKDIDLVLQNEPSIELDIPEEEDRLTLLSPKEIVQARVWLWLEGGYLTSSPNCAYSPKTRWLAERIYPDTLWGKRSVFHIPAELCLSANQRFRTEYRRARVTCKQDERMGAKALNRYIDVIATLNLLHAEGLPTPSLNHRDIKTIIASLDLKPEGRFRTLPHEVVFTSLRRAIEFALAHGDTLIDSYLALANEAKAHEQTIMSFSLGNDIRPFLSEGARALGVSCWTLSPIPTWNRATHNQFDKPSYFKALRENKGLHESLRVLYGAIQIIIGTLTARRQDELISLVAGSCLDASRTRLIFGNGKSGLMGMRQLEARPIPPVAVRLIEMLERLQTSMVDIGLIESATLLFAYPAWSGKTRLTSIAASKYNESLDCFCDWAELPLDREGQRYYIREHQLRRFFAMLFFWGGGFGGMDTLRWFLGHTDAQHLWHYITEFTPGVAIRSVAAQWAAYGVKHSTKEAELLGSELTEHFGTNDFSILEEEALQLYLEDLIEEGRLTVEPQFLDGKNQYRIAVILRPKEDAA